MVVIFIVLIAFIFPVFFTVTAIAGSVLVSMLEYSQLIGLWIVFNTAFIIQTVIAIISKIKKKKFGKGNAIRTIIFGIISFVLFVVIVILIFLYNYDTLKDLFSAWASLLS